MFTSESLQHIIKSFLKLLVSVSQCGYPGIPMNFQRRMKPDLWTGSSRTPQGDYRYLYVQLMHMRTPQGRYVYLCIIYIYIYLFRIHTLSDYQMCKDGIMYFTLYHKNHVFIIMLYLHVI